MAELVTKQTDQADVAKQHRIDRLFEKYPLKQLPTIDTSVQTDWSAPESQEKGIISRFRVIYQNPQATKEEVKAYFLPEIMKHCREIGWEINEDDYGVAAIDVVKIKDDPFKWTIFVMMKKNRASNKDVHFGEKTSNLKRLVDAAQRKMNRKSYAQ